MRCSASAASTAAIDFSREIESGTMTYGKRTTSFSGGRGGCRARRGSRPTAPTTAPWRSRCLRRAAADRDVAAPSRRTLRDDEDQEAVLEEGAGALGVGVLGKLEPALEGAGGPLEPEKPAEAAVGRETDAADGDDALL